MFKLVAAWVRENRTLIFRVVTVTASAATIGLTWPVWQARTNPPMLPLLPLPTVSLGVPILAALALTLFLPKSGLFSYCLLLAYGIVTDQTRLQPEFVSLAFLMAAGLPDRAGLALALAHVVTLWFWAGLNKLFSVTFMSQPSPWLLQGLVVDPPLWLIRVFPYLVVVGEAGLAFAAVLPRTRRLAAFWAFFLHAGILLTVSPLGHDWNRGVWPWNIVLAISGFFLLLPWKESLVESLRAQRPAVRLAVLLIAVYPAGFYVGVGEPYLAHNLYSENVPEGYSCDPSRGKCREFNPWRELNVPLPPMHHIFESYFSRTCDPGDFLLIFEHRRFFRRRGLANRSIVCPLPD